MSSLWAALPASDKFKALVDLVGVVLTAAGLLFAGYQFRRGVNQYKREQQWKRKDYTAREYDRLVSEPKTGLPLLMLDWDARQFPILNDREGKPVLVAVDRRMLGRALIPHQLKIAPPWGNEEAVIRDQFDAMLERLSSFEIMIGEGLIEQADLVPYLTYWIALIGDPHKRSSPDVIYILWLYIKYYEFALVPRLAKRFGYTLDVPSDFVDDLKKQCAQGRWSRKAPSSGAGRAEEIATPVSVTPLPLSTGHADTSEA